MAGPDLASCSWWAALPWQAAPLRLLAGEWYIAYHVSNGPNGGGTYRREVAVDKLTWNGDTPQKVTPSSGMTF